MIINCAHDEIVDLDLLIPNPKNPNKHPQSQIKLLAKIMKHQGWRSPVVVSNRSGFVTKGHGRIEAARLNKWTSAPVDRQDYGSEADEYADMVADNKIAELAETDLSMVLQRVLELGPDFDFDLLGIPDFKLPEDFEPQADEDDVPEQVEPRTKLGDIYALGRHRLMCGDSADSDALNKLMLGARADLTVTDPPYNVSYGKDNAKNPGGWSKSNRQIMNDSMSADEFRDFCRGWVSSIEIANSGCIYVFGPPGPDGRIMFGELDRAFHCSTTCVWIKDSLVLGRGKYHNRYEPCWFGWNGSGSNFSEDRKLTNVFEFDRPRKSDLHPTMKPVSLIEKCIEDGSRPGQAVLDLFGGSGTTMVACEKTGRSCFMMELDPRYCDVIISRWERYTGKEAKLAGSSNG